MSRSRPPATDYSRLVELLFSLYGSLHGNVFRPGLRGEELGRTEFGLLAHLRYRGRMTLSAAAEMLYMSRPQMSVIAERLVERGFVDRTQDPGDRRISWIAITDEGREVLEEALAATERHVEELLSPLGAAELAAATAALERLAPALGDATR